MMQGYVNDNYEAVISVVVKMMLGSNLSVL